MKAKLITTLISMVVGMLSPDLMKSFADMLLDFVEDKVMATENTVDDKILLPICKMIRDAFDIPDND